MEGSFLNLLRVKETREKITTTLLLLLVYRLGFQIPIPGMSVTFLSESVGNQFFGMVSALTRCIEDTDDFTKHPFIHNAPYWRAHNVTPNGKQVWAWGDGGWDPYYFAHYNFGAIRMTQDATAQALHRHLFDQQPGAYAYHGFTLTHYDPSLEPGNLDDAAISAIA